MADERAPVTIGDKSAMPFAESLPFTLKPVDGKRLPAVRVAL